jgi:hypothetical protein
MPDLPPRSRLDRLPASGLLELAGRVHLRLTELGERLVALGADAEVGDLTRLHAERQRLLVYYIDLWDAFELACPPERRGEQSSAG